MKKQMKKIISVLTVTSILGAGVATPFNVLSETPVKAATSDALNSTKASNAILALFANNNPSTNVLKSTTDQQAIDAAQQLVDVVANATVRANMQLDIEKAKDLLKIKNTQLDYSLLANDADITSVAITGTSGKGITSVRLLIGGAVKATGTLNTDGTYSIQTNDFITQGSKVEVAGYNGTTEVARKTVKVSNNEKPLAPGANEALAKTMAAKAVSALFQDDKSSTNTLKPTTAQKTIDFAQNMINAVLDPVVKANMQKDLDKAQNLLNASNVSLTIAPYKLGTDGYITGTFRGDITKVELQVNQVAIKRIGVKDGIINFYAKPNITKPTDVVEMVGYNSAGEVISTKAVPFASTGLNGSVTLNPFLLGTDGYVKGQFTGDVAKISLSVNNVEQKTINVPTTGTDFLYYAKLLIKNRTDIVTLTAYNAIGSPIKVVSIPVL